MTTMNCADVQTALWNAELSESMQQHLQSCHHCRQEQQFLQGFLTEFEQAEIPMPTRSFVPSVRELKKSLRLYRQRRMQKWLIGSAAAACLLAVATQAPKLLPGVFHHQGGPTTQPTQPSQPQQPGKTPTPTPPVNPNITFSPRANELDILNAVAAYWTAHPIAPDTAKIELLAYKQDALDGKTSSSGLVFFNVDGQQQILRGTFVKQNGAWQVISLAEDTPDRNPPPAPYIVPVVDNTGDARFGDAIRAYLQKTNSGHPEIRQITLTKFTPDAPVKKGDTTASGTVALTYEYKKGASQQEQPPHSARKHVQLQIVQGVWTVVEMTDVPLKE